MQASSAVASEQYPVTSPNNIYESSHSVARNSQCVTQQHKQHNTQNTLSVIGVGVTTRVLVPGPLFDDFFYTERVEIERAGCRVQRFDV